MLEIASEIIICLLLAALIGFALGYLVGKSQSEKSKAVTPLVTEENEGKEKPEVEELIVEEEPIEEDAVVEETKVSEEVEIPTENAIGQALEALEALEDIEEQETETAKEDAQEGKKPELLLEARDGKKDNLTDIKGIGPKVEEKLNAAGIYHFEQIANWTEANMLWLEAHTLFASRAKKELWIEESKSFL
jgi:NADH-quinone oxidoreductase subunit E